MISRWRAGFFSLLVALGVLVVCEAIVSVVHFHRTVDEPSALVAFSKGLAQIGIRQFSPIGIFEDDPKLGYRHKRNVKGRHVDLDFSVTYELGSNGERVIPVPAQSRGRIVFVGGSYTFGHGVKDDEVFPAVLAREYWPEWTVTNRAVAGYGTAHAYLNVVEELESESPPSAIIYPLLNGHIVRNYISEAWLGSLAIFGRHHPHFEIESGELVYQGIVGVDAAKPIGEATSRMEQQLTILMLHEMQRLCRDRGVAFFVVLLPGERWPPAVAAAAFQLDRPPLDLSQIGLEGFRNDGHPNAVDHERFAALIAESPIQEWVVEAARGATGGAE